MSAAKLHQAELETADEMIAELQRLNDRYCKALELISTHPNAEWNVRAYARAILEGKRDA